MEGFTAHAFQLPQDTFKAENMVQLGMLSILPYFAELVLEHGPVRAVTTILHQVRATFILPPLSPLLN